MTYPASSSFNKRITFLEWQKTSDNAGGETGPWKEIKSAWAHIQAASASRLMEADQIEHRVPYTIQVHYQHVSTSWRVKYKKQVFIIKSAIDPDELHEIVEMVCEEEQNIGIVP